MSVTFKETSNFHSTLSETFFTPTVPAISANVTVKTNYTLPFCILVVVLFDVLPVGLKEHLSQCGFSQNQRSGAQEMEEGGHHQHLRLDLKEKANINKIQDKQIHKVEYYTLNSPKSSNILSTSSNASGSVHCLDELKNTIIKLCQLKEYFNSLNTVTFSLQRITLRQYSDHKNNTLRLF